jgi:hypothetical protein
MLLTGHCHCGNIHFEFETGCTPASLPLRACQCSFCRAHGAVTVSDPSGNVRLAFTERAAVRHYRFGLGITDMLICMRCGCYAAAIMETDGRKYATLNANLLDCRAELTAAPAPVDYAAETAEQRVARRKVRWTPVAGDQDPLKA